MFGHVKTLITAYHHGELASDERRRVESHIAVCAGCRSAFDEIRTTTLLLRGFASTGPITVPAKPVRAAGALVLIVTFSLFAWRQPILVDAPSEFRLGQWLNIASEVTLKVGEIGYVRLEPKTRLRLTQDQPTEQRIEMQRGTMHAFISAPPRLFFVDTPSATATDLGCAYTLKVDDRGDSLLTVILGFVQLDSNGRASIVRAGWAAKTRKGAGPGTPYLVESSETMKQDIDIIDFSADAAAKSAALDRILNDAGINDQITLYHLLQRVPSDERRRVAEKLVQFASLPDAVSLEGTVALDADAMSRWEKHIGLVW
jgi:hypothetical protein